MKLIKKLQECSTIAQADPILHKLHAGPAVRKLVETAIILNNSPDPQQRSHAFSFMESAIKEMEDDEKKIHEEQIGMHSHEDGLPTKPIGVEGSSTKHKALHEEEDDDDEHKMHEEEDDDERKHEMREEENDHREHKIHEEELKNHNNGPREEGSEQSTDNTAPYPGQGKDTENGERPMQDMRPAYNQWNETNGIQPMGNGMLPGLAPDVAQEMGMILPELPPMDTNQMMRQMQYTVDSVISNFRKNEIEPLRKRLQEQTQQNHKDKKYYSDILRQQKEAIKTLSQELQETKARSGSMSLDIDALRNNSTAKFRETVPELQRFVGFDERGIPGIQPLPGRQAHKLDTVRSEIEQMDKILNSKNSIYN